MEKNALMAVMLSMVILLVWFKLSPPPAQPVAPVMEASKAESGTAAGTAEAIKAVTAEKKYGKQPEEKTFTVQTKESIVEFSSKGGSITGWYIREKAKEKAYMTDIVLCKTGGFLPVTVKTGEEGDFSEKTFALETGGIDNGTVIALDEGQSREIRFSCAAAGNLRITKTYRLSYDGFVQDFELKIRNQSNEKRTVKNISVLWDCGLGISHEGTTKKETDNYKRMNKENYMNMKVFSFVDGRIRKRLRGGEFSKDLAWTGMVNRYFLQAFINKNRDFDTFALANGNTDVLEKGFMSGERLVRKSIIQAGLSRGELELSPGEEKTLSLSMYLGLKKKEELLKAGNGLDAVNTQGMLGPVRAAIKAALLFFYRITKSYGIAIILLSCTLQLLMFPLSVKSMQASKKMKDVQPLMKNLQIKYKNDPKRLNAETMELYKTKGVNPFGGCLPVVLQMPIFFALFTVLRESVELRYEGFLWVPDLTMMDPLYILPILMGGAMFFQQKFTMPAGGDPSQAKMMMFMPVLFTFMFLQFPAGLVVYWLTSNILSIAQYAFYAMKEKKSRVLVVP